VSLPLRRRRQINRTLHIMATVQLRNPTEGRAYYDRKKGSGKTSVEAMRCLKRRVSDIVYRTKLNDAMRAVTGPGGHRGTSTKSSVAGSIPTPALRTSHFPDRHDRAYDRPPSRVLTQRGARSGRFGQCGRAGQRRPCMTSCLALSGLHGQGPLGHGQDPPGGTGKTASLGLELSGLQGARPTRGACPARPATCPSPQHPVNARREATGSY
jgi:hypothetical protein